MADSENKTVNFQYKISCIHTNVTVIGWMDGYSNRNESPIELYSM